MTASATAAIRTTRMRWSYTGIGKRWFPWAVISLALVWSVAQTDIFKRDLVNWDGFSLAWEFARAAVHPNIDKDILRLAWSATWVTTAYAFAGTFLCVCLGLIFGTVSSEVFWSLVFPGERTRPTFLWTLVRSVLAFPRGLHEVIWGLVLLQIFGLNPLVAILAIGIHFGAITAKVFSEILDETAKEPVKALRAAGAPVSSSLLYGLLPVAFPDLLSYSFYRLECAIRSAAVLGLIGAGGLGYQVLLSLQSLRYDQVWTFLYALILLCGLTDAWSACLHRRMGSATCTELGSSTRVSKQTTRVDESSSRMQMDSWVRLTLILSAVAVAWSFWYLNPAIKQVIEPVTWHRTTSLVREAFPPRTDGALLINLWKLSCKTLAMSILAIWFAGVAGILLAFPAASNFLLPGGLVHTTSSSAAWLGTAIFIAVRGLLVVLRALSEPIWALIALFFLFPGVVPGAFGLGFYNLGVLGRLMAEATENLDQRPLLALKAQGANSVQLFLYGVLPTALPRFIAFVLYRWEVCIRATVVVGVVGAGGIGRLLAQQIASFDYSGVLTSLIFLIAICFLADLISRQLRSALR